MKVIKSKSWLIAGSVLGLLLISGVVYALNSGSFATRGQTWADAVCTQDLLKTPSTTENNRLIAECFSYFKSKENSTALSNQHQQLVNLGTTVFNQGQQINTLNTSPKPVLVQDANGQLIGSLVGIDPLYVFHSSTKTIAHVETGTNPYRGWLGSVPSETYYITNDCTGDFYIIQSADPYNAVPNRLYNLSHVNYTESPPANINYHSIDHNGGCDANLNGYQSLSKLNQVNLGINQPIALPLKYNN